MRSKPSNSLDVNVLVGQLMGANEGLVHNNATLSDSVRALSHENQRLREKCEELAKFIKTLQEIPTQFSSGPLWMSEEEEDAQYKYDSGQINRAELAETLQSLGLEPHIVVDE